MATQALLSVPGEEDHQVDLVTYRAGEEVPIPDVLAVCPALAEVAERYGHPECVSRLPDMAMFDGETESASDEIVGLGGTLILYVGNLERYQGIDLLVDAVRLVADDYPEAERVVVGGDEASISRYKASVSGLVEQGRVYFLGPRPLTDLGSILAVGHIPASPRLTGVNTPMKIYSYLESGRPVIATLRTHTQVLDAESAVLVTPEPDAVAQGLASLLANPPGLSSRPPREVR